MTTVVQGMPVQSAIAATPTTDDTEALRQLSGLGFPAGLSHELIASAREFPVRFIVLDNSGSMNMNDGTRIVRTPAGKTTAIKASRWNELVDTILGIGELATALGARTDFYLLNPSPHGQFLMTGDDGSTSFGRIGQPVNMPELKRRFQAMSPSGGTPLTEAVMRVISLIEPEAATLRASGQKAAVVLATDGLPNDRVSFLEALRQLQRLPVWLVVRLCTDDDAVVGYWNDLDAQLECDMEVLDDLFGEGAEVHQLNSWLRSSPLLHKARTFGLPNKLFDLLDEQALVPSQVKQCVEAILGCGVLPEPDAGITEFRAAVKEALTGAPPVFDPVSRTMRPWVNADELCKSPSWWRRIRCLLG
tara:strand:+ start:91 stop:1173 length:1083 start_codon:yes stop_codon:yes gene_type:complete